MLRQNVIRSSQWLPVRYMSTSPKVLKPLYQHYKISKLEDLNKIENIEDVDPQLIKRLIDEKTDTLNSENELKMMKQLLQEQNSMRKATLRPFIRPAWILFLMSSTVYMGWQFYWWYCEYNRKEIELKNEVDTLENELQSLIDHKNTKPWYKRWFRL